MTTGRLALLLMFACGHGALAAPIVWSGYDHNFTKADGVDPFSLAGQDRLTAQVSLSRVNEGGGLINTLGETSYSKPTSPTGTRWAFSYGNPTKVVAAWNYAELVFLPWADAFGSNTAGGPPGTIGQPSVVHLVAEDIYLDVRLTAWTVRTGGGFAYERASGPTLGDYNADGLITTLDYDAWSGAFNTSATLPDGNRDGTVNAADYTVWRDRFTAPATARAVPEPPMLAPFTSALLIAALTVCGRTQRLLKRRKTRVIREEIMKL
jgi:hypothetical protein